MLLAMRTDDLQMPLLDAFDLRNPINGTHCSGEFPCKWHDLARPGTYRTERIDSGNLRFVERLSRRRYSDMGLWLVLPVNCNVVLALPPT